MVDDFGAILTGWALWSNFTLVEVPIMVWVNTSPLVKTYTLEEFWELPEPPDRSKLELIAGVLYMTAPPDYAHDIKVSRFDPDANGGSRSDW